MSLEWNTLKFLLFDADSHYRALTRQMLSQLGATHVAEVDIGDEAREVTAEWRPDIIIGAMTSLNTDVLNFISWLRSRETTPCPGVPVLLLVMVTDQEPLVQAIRTGVDYFIAKPTSLRMLRDRIERVVRDPLPQIQTSIYTGPDRRRSPDNVYNGPERRQATQA